MSGFARLQYNVIVILIIIVNSQERTYREQKLNIMS